MKILMSEGRFMIDIRRLLAEFLADERGATAIEYSLLAVGIMVAIIATAAALGSSLDAPPSGAPDR
jgi:pilus assembly protein Flp/PilA